MKKTILSFLLFLPLLLCAQGNNAVALLENAIKKIEADAAVQMTFSYSVYDAGGTEQFSDDGSLKLDGGRYALLLSPMKLWCDGQTQWSYMAQVNEVYITDADSEEAQIYNPVYLMGLYKKGYTCSVESAGGKNVITLQACEEQDFDKVILSLDAKTSQPVAMCIFVDGQGYTTVDVTSYKSGYDFDSRVYTCPLEDFPTAEIVDMR